MDTPWSHAARIREVLLYLLLCASLRLLCLRVAQILHSMHVVCFHVCNFSYQFTAQIFAEHVLTIQHSVCHLATSVVRDHQFSTIHLCGLSLVRTLAQFFELGKNNWMSPRLSTECGSSGLKCAQWRMPASRYIVAFIVNIK